MLPPGCIRDHAERFLASLPAAMRGRDAEDTSKTGGTS